MDSQCVTYAFSININLQQMFLKRKLTNKYKLNIVKCTETIQTTKSKTKEVFHQHDDEVITLVSSTYTHRYNTMLR